VASAAAQPVPRVMLERGRIVVQSEGNELSVAERAPVGYTALDALVRDIERPDGRRDAPVRLTRAAPRQVLDWALGVTREGTLVIGQRTYTFEPTRRDWVFTRGEILRSYPPLSEGDGWLWLVDVAVGRETSVLLSMRAPARWPVESVRVTAERRW